MNLVGILKKAGEWGPVFFGVGFIAPLVSQSMLAAEVSAPLGLSTLQLGLVIGTSMGLVAKLRGSWL